MSKKVLTEAHLLKLREDMAAVVLAVSRERKFFVHSVDRAEIVEEILRIPLLSALLVDNMVDLPPERVGFLIGQIKAPPSGG